MSKKAPIILVLLAAILLLPATGMALGGGLAHIHSFSGDYYIKGTGETAQEYFQIGDWDISGVSLHLEYDITPLEDAGLAAEVYVNDAFAGSYSLEKGSSRRSLDIDLPGEGLYLENANVLSIKIAADKALENCMEGPSPAAKWVNFFKESYIRVDYRPQGQCRSIGEFYKCMTSIEALDNSVSALCLPKSPSAKELTVAANAAAALSGNAPLFRENLLLVNGYSSLPQDARHTIYIAEYGNVEPIIKNALTQSQKNTAENGALMALIEVEGRHLLLVTGGDKAFLNAAKAISNRPYMEGLNAGWKEVFKEENYLSPGCTVEQYMKLSEEGEYIAGNFEQIMHFYIDYPANRRIAKSSGLSLDFTYSHELDFERSLLTVFINDIPIGSKKLERERAAGDMLELSFPEDLDMAGDFHIKLSFQLDPGEDWCNSSSQPPWAYVHGSSMLKIASSDLLYADFSSFPSPFLRDGAMDDVMILLPEGPMREELQAMHAVALSLGRFMKENHGDLRVDFYESAGDLSGANVIAIGEYERNPILKAQEGFLPLKFLEDGSLVETGQRNGAESGGRAGLGAAQIILSPYSDQVKALLVISGFTAEDMLMAAKAMGSQEGLWRLSGDAFTVDRKGNVRTFLFDGGRGGYRMPVSKELKPPERAMTAVLALGGILLIAALAAGLIFIRHGGSKR